MKKANKDIKKEMEKIYERHLEWISVGRKLKVSFLDSLKESPKLTMLIKLGVAANVGIWLLVILKICEKISF